MTKTEFNQCFKIAQDKSISCDYSNLHLFDGFALKSFKNIVCTTTDLAALIRWQAAQLNGNWDLEQIQEIFNCKHKFKLIGLNPTSNLENSIEI